MEETIPEIPKPEGIALVTKATPISIAPSGESFEGKDVFIPALGTLRLDGTRGIDYGKDEMGIGVVGNELIVDKARNFYEKGLFHVGVWLKGLPQPRMPLICEVILFDGTKFEGEFQFVRDEELEEHQASIDLWNLANDNETKRILFMPADNSYLSQLRFSFRAKT